LFEEELFLNFSGFHPPKSWCFPFFFSSLPPAAFLWFPIASRTGPIFVCLERGYSGQDGRGDLGFFVTSPPVFSNCQGITRMAFRLPLLLETFFNRAALPPLFPPWSLLLPSPPSNFFHGPCLRLAGAIPECQFSPQEIAGIFFFALPCSLFSASSLCFPLFLPHHGLSIGGQNDAIGPRFFHA